MITTSTKYTHRFYGWFAKGKGKGKGKASLDTKSNSVIDEQRAEPLRKLQALDVFSGCGGNVLTVWKFTIIKSYCKGSIGFIYAILIPPLLVSENKAVVLITVLVII